MAMCLNMAIANKLSGFFAGTTDSQRLRMKAWMDEVVILNMPAEPDKSERKRYLHIVKTPDTHEWMDEVEPDDFTILALDSVLPTAEVWQQVV